MTDSAKGHAQKLIGCVVRRFIDTTHPTSKTNISTASGASLMAFGTALLQIDDPMMHGVGIACGLAGFFVTLYKEQK